MRRDWKGKYRRDLQHRASERGKFAATRRWSKEKIKRERLSELDPIQVGGRIVERWIRIIGESVVRERTIYEFDRACDWQRKRKELWA